MSRVRPDQPLIPSVLDRLIDLDPQSGRETPRNRSQLLREMKDSVRRDLQNLLNTRSRVSGFPDELKELDRSLVSYGIPDFTGTHVVPSQQRTDLQRKIEAAIRAFEPRLTRVVVELLKNADSTDRTVRFRIDAMLKVDPAPEPVIFDSALEPTTGTFEVRGVGR